MSTSVDGSPGGGGRMECGICWQVYDPAQGDLYWQVPPGTAFADLPEHWSCPNCDAPRHKFLPVVA
jgi:rubredoxin